MFRTPSNRRPTPIASVQLPLLCLGAILLLAPLLAAAQDHRCQVTVRKADKPGPSAACLAAAAYDAKRGDLFIVGGFDPPHKDAPPTMLKYRIGKRTWAGMKLADAAPNAGVKPALVYDPKRDALFLFGGWAFGADGPSAQLWTLPLAKGKTHTWQLIDVGQNHPPARNGCVMILDASRDRLLVHGGDGGPHPEFGFTPLDDLWAFDLAKQEWSRLRPTGQFPEARWNHVGAVDQKNGKVFVFGGGGYADNLLVRDNCIFELDLDTLVWTRHAVRGDPPSPVQGTTMTHDQSADVLLVVGGLSMADTGPSGSKSLWLFDLKSKTWAEYPDVFPTTRRDHTAIYDPRGRQHIIHGGETTTQLGNYYAHGDALRDTLMISITAKK